MLMIVQGYFSVFWQMDPGLVGWCPIHPHLEVTKAECFWPQKISLWSSSQVNAEYKIFQNTNQIRCCEWSFFQINGGNKTTPKITMGVFLTSPKFVGLWHWLYHMIWAFHVMSLDSRCHAGHALPRAWAHTAAILLAQGGWGYCLNQWEWDTTIKSTTVYHYCYQIVKVCHEYNIYIYTHEISIDGTKDVMGCNGHILQQ